MLKNKPSPRARPAAGLLPRRRWCALLLAGAASGVAVTAAAEDAAPAVSAPATTTAPAASTPAATPAPCPARPAISFNRWSENWSVLAAPCVPAQPFDSLKYRPLSADGLTYLSLGVNLRERMEHNDAPSFGIGAGGLADTYVIQRTEVHADLRLGADWQVFTQIEDARAFHKEAIGPVDQDQLDLEQAFVTYAAMM